MSKLKMIIISIVIISACMLFTACPPSYNEEPKYDVINEIESYEVHIKELEYTYNPCNYICHNKSDLLNLLDKDIYSSYVSKYDDSYFNINTLVIITLLEDGVPIKYESETLNGQYVIVNNTLKLYRNINYSNDYHYITLFVSVKDNNKQISSLTTIFINSNNQVLSFNEKDIFINELLDIKYDEKLQSYKYFNLSDLQVIKNNGNLNKCIYMSVEKEFYYSGNIYVKRDKVKILNEIDFPSDIINNSAFYYFSGQNCNIYKLQIALKEGLITRDDILISEYDDSLLLNYESISLVYFKRYMIEDLNGNIISTGKIVYVDKNNNYFNYMSYYFDENSFIIYNDESLETKLNMSAYDLYKVAKFKGFSSSTYRRDGVVRILYGTTYNNIDLRSKYEYRETYDGNVDMTYWLFNYNDILRLIKDE